MNSQSRITHKADQCDSFNGILIICITMFIVVTVIMFGETSRKSYIKPFGIFGSQMLQKFAYSGKLDKN